MYTVIEHSDICKKMNPTEGIVFWTLVTAVKLKYTQFKTVADLHALVPFDISFRTFRRTLYSLREQGFIDYATSKESVSVKIKKVIICSDNASIVHSDIGTNCPSQRDKLSSSEGQIVLLRGTNCPPQRDKLSSSEGQIVLLRGTNCPSRFALSPCPARLDALPN